MGARGSKSGEGEEVLTRVLTLGAEGSGKSTFHKQMRILFQDPFSSDDKQDFARALMKSVAAGLQRVVDQLDELKIKLPRQSKKVPSPFSIAVGPFSQLGRVVLRKTPPCRNWCLRFRRSRAVLAHSVVL